MLQTTHSNAMLDLTASLPNMLFQPHGGRVVDLRTELSRLRPNPLEPLLKRLGQKGSWDWDYTTTSTRFRANYRCYFLSLERSLKVASLETRMRHSGAGFAMKHHLRMTRGEREIARRYHAVSRYASLDLYATLVWARTMLDDVAGL